MKSIGMILGLVTAFVLFAQVVSSFFRKRIGGAFRKLHLGLGIVLTLLFCAHGTLLFLTFGPPRSLWHLCGTAAATVALLALISGFARKRIGEKFLSLHRVLGIAALVLAILHRMLAFI